MLRKKIKEIELLIKYGAPENDQHYALALVEHYQDDIIALNVFVCFYSFLPEGQNDAITKLHLVSQKGGVLLLIASTAVSNYLFLSNSEDAFFLGKCDEGIWDEEVLNYFGYKTREASIDALADIKHFSEYLPSVLNEKLFPACSSRHGEFHVFGCPVEICPWCQSQLTYCNCRFKQMGCEHVKTEGQLATLLELLEEKGRIPFDSEKDRPHFPYAVPDNMEKT